MNNTIKVTLNVYSYPKDNPRNKALNPNKPVLISSLLNPITNAETLISMTAKSPHNPIEGEKNVTNIIIAANKLFNEKNIKL